MIAFIKEGSRASFWALNTSWSQYLRREAKHSEEQPCRRKTGKGQSRGQVFTTGHSVAPLGCWLTARRAPERWAVQTLKHQEKHQTRSSEKHPRFYKQVPAKLCWTHRSWAARKDRHCPPGTPPLGTELGLQGHGCGLPPHPLTQGTQAPPTSKVGWAQGQHEGLRLQCQGKRLRRP